LLKISTGKRLTNSFKGDLAGHGLTEGIAADDFVIIHPALNYNAVLRVSKKTV